MKQLTWKIILPLTVISFSFFTKWWYVLPVDAPDSMMSGFPLIWLSEGWHTSSSLQIFVSELIINLMSFFLFWFLIVYICNQYIVKIKIPKIVTILMLSITSLICLGVLLIGSMPDNIYKTKRDFDIEVLTTGYKLNWQHQQRPRYQDFKAATNKK